MENYKNSMVFYESAYLAINYLPTNELKWEAVNGLFEYGFYGVVPESDNPFINMVYVQAIPSMRNAKERYLKAVENGKKGGRPTNIDAEKIMQLKADGKTNKEIAEMFSCSEKTIEYHITEYNKNKKSIKIESDKDIESDTYSDTDTDTERFLGFQGDNNISDEIALYILKHWKGNSIKNLVDITNKKYNINLSYNDVKSICDEQKSDNTYKTRLENSIRMAEEKVNKEAQRNKFIEQEKKNINLVINACKNVCGFTPSEEEIMHGFIEDNKENGYYRWTMHEMQEMVEKHIANGKNFDEVRRSYADYRNSMLGFY